MQTYILLLADILMQYVSYAHALLGSRVETRHVDRVPRPVSLENGVLMIEVTVGLRQLSANTSLWPRLQLDGRSGRPGLINRLAAPLLWGCFTRVSLGL